MKRALGFMNKGSLLDTDAQAFITASVITDPTQISGINTLVVALKGYSLWSKFKAIYPLVGGTADKHKWNLKDPRDLDAAFRLTYLGTLTHNSLGITGSTNGACFTYLQPSTILTASNNHLANYCSTDTNAVAIEMGTDNYALFNRILNSAYSDNTSSNRINASNTNSTGFYVSTRTSTTSHKLYKNASIHASSTALSTTALSSGTVSLLMLNNASPYYSNRRYGWFSIGDGLSDTEEANLYTAVQAYQTTLGRQV